MITLLDGGMGMELIKRGVAEVTGFWSAQALLEAPDTVVEVHKDYIAAGARIITTNSYSTIPSYLEKGELADRFVELTQLAGELARRAVNESGDPSVRVAGSIPPLSESYRPDLVPAKDEAQPVYEHMVKALAANADLFLCETMSSADEAVNAVSQAVMYGDNKPVMVSWTLKESPGAGLRSGESITEAFSKLGEYPVEGFLFNCTQPEAIVVALNELRPLTTKPIGGYPNRFNALQQDWTLDNDVSIGFRADLDVDSFVETAIRFQESGADIIGGCCGIGPEYIAALVASSDRIHLDN